MLLDLPLGPDRTLAFAVIWLGLTAFPGPSVAYCASVSARVGLGAGLYATLGFALAVACYASLGGMGLIGLVLALPGAVTALGWLGAAYLAWLAWVHWRLPPRVGGRAPPRPRQGLGFTLRAVGVALTNPKSALSYTLVYPGFLGTGEGAVARLIQLGGMSIVTALIVYAGYALAADRLGRLIRTERQALWRNRAFAAVFAAGAVALGHHVWGM